MEIDPKIERRNGWIYSSLGILLIIMALYNIYAEIFHLIDDKGTTYDWITFIAGILIGIYLVFVGVKKIRRNKPSDGSDHTPQN